MHVNFLWKTVDESYFSQIGFFFIEIPDNYQPVWFLFFLYLKKRIVWFDYKPNLLLYESMQHVYII